ncbi:MAG: RNA pseudouridine synthase [Bacteroidales bacterium]|jgi:tRNA pseudouridine32 synthase/23S rRNA pseudouridine746 synthase|nr:RNA pseudouridine synthase [Bacteroidales bacterium]
MFFHPLHIPKISPPVEFTFPFHYIPHPLCLIAAQQVFDYLEHQQDFQHDFGIHHHVDGVNVGKMFGVLIVENTKRQIGFLAAFSGKLANTQTLPFFVPPIVNITHEESFYRQSEQVLNEYNMLITSVENDENYQNLLAELAKKTNKMQAELADLKTTMKTAKAERDAQRAEAHHAMTAQEYETLCEQLKIESLRLQYRYKQCGKQWRTAIDELQQKINIHTSHIQSLKNTRKQKSEQLQYEIFSHYTFLNAHGERKSLNEIFNDIPPSGAGECAAPKLLNYAYEHGYKPRAMAEFWWGQSPKSQIRKHKHFYPACKTKCEPILGHMLQGLQVEKNPILTELAEEKTVKILFDDDDIVVINKPAGMLSVPGNVDAESAFTYLQKIYTEGIFIVHRLDMATSGIMVFAKNKNSCARMQQQFSERSIKKRYIAILQGIIPGNEGSISLPLRPDFDNRPQQMVCSEHGKPSFTSWKVIERTATTTKVHLYPHTGRTHQLRVHASHHAGLNAPIVGDDLYGTKSDRLYLHAEYIEFNHPTTNKRVHFQCSPEF